VVYPDEGELFKASEKKSEHLVFFAHFFQGHKKALKRHIELVNELGYDAYAFNLKDGLKENQYLPYSPTSKKFGMKHSLADQIEQHLNLLSEYPTKIIFAFSNVAGSAMEAMARREPFDSVAMVCDSGPGINLIYSSFQLVEHQLHFKNILAKLAGAPLVVLGWSPLRHKDIPEDLKKFPEGFPLLSIRGWKDPMISPSQIDKVFESAPQIHWRKLALPEAGHLNGLRDYPTEYRSGLEDFLNSL
jgi:hypothetical protein